MAEKTLNSPLSGEEIQKAIRDQIEQKMRKDCYLNPNHAYDWYTAEIEIHYGLHDVGTTLEGEAKITYSYGEKPLPPAEVKEGEVGMSIQAESPNRVRVQSGQPVHVLTKDKEGHSIVEGIKYGRAALLRT
jgi:hypothetical protein